MADTNAAKRQRHTAAAAEVLQVQVISALSGAPVATLELPRSASVDQVKRELQATCGVNACCQRLILASFGGALEDCDALSDLPEPITLALVQLAHVDDQETGARLIAAAERGDADLAAELLRLPARPDPEVAGARHTPLTAAARNGHTEVVKLLCEAGADPDRANRSGATPLALAACYGYLDVARLLCDAGADLDKGDVSPLFVAAKNGNAGVVRLFCQSGADKNKAALGGTLRRGAGPWAARGPGGAPGDGALPRRGPEGAAARWPAAAAPSGSPRGAARQGPGEPLALGWGDAGRTDRPLSDTDRFVRRRLWSERDLDCAARKRRCDADDDELHSLPKQARREEPDAPLSARGGCEDGATPLYVAALKGHTEVVRVLLDFKASKDIPASNGMKPLSAASRGGHAGVVRLLCGEAWPGTHQRAQSRRRAWPGLPPDGDRAVRRRLGLAAAASSS